MVVTPPYPWVFHPWLTPAVLPSDTLCVKSASSPRQHAGGWQVVGPTERSTAFAKGRGSHYSPHLTGANCIAMNTRRTYPSQHL